MVEQSKIDDKPPGVGIFTVLFGAVILFFLGWICSVVYAWYNASPPAVISLSAYFVDSKPVPSEDRVRSYLKIRGKVYQSGQPLKEGNVRLTASRRDRSFQQAVSLDLKDGQFETDDPAWGQLYCGDQIHIAAEVWSSQLSGPATSEIYLNSAAPVLTQTGEIMVWGVINRR